MYIKELNRAQRKARKRHQCFDCYRDIVPGTVYSFVTFKILAFGLLSACNTAPQDRCDKPTYHNRACESREAQPRPERIRQIDAVTPRPSRPAPEPAANHQPAEEGSFKDAI